MLKKIGTSHRASREIADPDAHARPDAQRILDGIARRLLTEELEAGIRCPRDNRP